MKTSCIVTYMAFTAAAGAVTGNAGADTATGDKPQNSCVLDNVPVPAFAMKTLSSAQFTALHAAVTPHGAGERWAEIPWQSDLGAARREAARQQKPLLMWVMDGHPLGCT